MYEIWVTQQDAYYDIHRTPRVIITMLVTDCLLTMCIILIMHYYGVHVTSSMLNVGFSKFWEKGDEK